MNKKIFSYLDKLYPNAQCELNFEKDYELLIATVLSAQTTDKRVNEVTAVLFKKYPSIKALSEANIDDLAKIIMPIGTYKVKSKYIHDITTRLVKDNLDYIPNDREYIESLPGVGHKTANVFLSNIYDVPALAVDTHVARVSKRLGIAKEKDDVSVIEKKLMKLVPKNRWSKTHHQLVLFGRYHCKAKNPNCLNCEIREYCHYNKRNISN